MSARKSLWSSQHVGTHDELKDRILDEKLFEWISKRIDSTTTITFASGGIIPTYNVGSVKVQCPSGNVIPAIRVDHIVSSFPRSPGEALQIPASQITISQEFQMKLKALLGILQDDLNVHLDLTFTLQSMEILQPEQHSPQTYLKASDQENFLAFMEIQLPVHHKGGELHVQFENRTITFNNDFTEDFVYFRTFRSETSVQIHPVSEGSRVSIMFHVFTKPGFPAPDLMIDTEIEEAVLKFHSFLKNKSLTFGSLLNPLEHGKRTLILDRMRNSNYQFYTKVDKVFALANLFRSARDQFGNPLFDLALGNFQKVEGYPPKMVPALFVKWLSSEWELSSVIPHNLPLPQRESFFFVSLLERECGADIIGEHCWVCWPANVRLHIFGDFFTVDQRQCIQVYIKSIMEMSAGYARKVIRDNQDRFSDHEITALGSYFADSELFLFGLDSSRNIENKSLHFLIECEANDLVPWSDLLEHLKTLIEHYGGCLNFCEFVAQIQSTARKMDIYNRIPQQLIFSSVAGYNAWIKLNKQLHGRVDIFSRLNALNNHSSEVIQHVAELCFGDSEDFETPSREQIQSIVHVISTKSPSEWNISSLGRVISLVSSNVSDEALLNNLAIFLAAQIESKTDRILFYHLEKQSLFKLVPVIIPVLVVFQLTSKKKVFPRTALLLAEGAFHNNDLVGAKIFWCIVFDWCMWCFLGVDEVFGSLINPVLSCNDDDLMEKLAHFLLFIDSSRADASYWNTLVSLSESRLASKLMTVVINYLEFSTQNKHPPPGSFVINLFITRSPPNHEPDLLQLFKWIWAFGVDSGEEHRMVIEHLFEPLKTKMGLSDCVKSMLQIMTEKDWRTGNQLGLMKELLRNLEVRKEFTIQLRDSFSEFSSETKVVETFIRSAIELPPFIEEFQEFLTHTFSNPAHGVSGGRDTADDFRHEIMHSLFCVFEAKFDPTVQKSLIDIGKLYFIGSNRTNKIVCKLLQTTWCANHLLPPVDPQSLAEVCAATLLRYPKAKLLLGDIAQWAFEYLSANPIQNWLVPDRPVNISGDKFRIGKFLHSDSQQTTIFLGDAGTEQYFQNSLLFQQISNAYKLEENFVTVTQATNGECILCKNSKFTHTETTEKYCAAFRKWIQQTSIEARTPPAKRRKY